MNTLKRIAIVAALLAPGFSRAGEISHAEVWAEELTFAALRSADAAQSVHLHHHDPLFYENSGAFSGGWLIGQEPSDRAQYLYGAGEIVLHAAVTLALVHYQVSPWVIRGWEAVTIGIDATAVAKNARLGMHTHF